MQRMQWSVIVSLIVGISFQAQATYAQFGGFFGGPKVETIETDELVRLMNAQRQLEARAQKSGQEPPTPTYVLLDVRSEAEVNVSVIPGALTKAQYEANRERYADRLVIPYCTVGGRSATYAKELARKGVTVKNYAGSILHWIESELPLVTLKGEPTQRVHTYSNSYRVPAQYVKVTGR